MNDNLRLKLKNMTTGKKYISERLNTYNEHDKIENEDKLDILTLLLYHPTKTIDINNIEYLTMQIRAPFNNLALYYKYKNNDKLDDISYVSCINNLFGKYKFETQHQKDVITAFRNESHFGTKKKYFLDNTTKENDKFYGVCVNCDLRTNDITTDHYNISFKQIFTDFMKLENLSFDDIDIYENDNNEIRLKCTILANKWSEYHDICAKYRLLCSSCNSHFGAYGYKY